MSRLTRRQFIGRTAIIAGSLPLFAWDDACQRANVTTSTLQTFRSSLDGTVIYPVDQGYAQAALAYNRRYHHAPMMIVVPKNAHDVKKAVEFAKAHSITLSPRGGGHNYCGWSTCDGMVIDFQDMAGVSLTNNASRAHIGPGAMLLDAYQTLWCEGKCSLPGGTCPSVGLAGYTLGGGWGLYSRAWGFMCDRLREVQAVTADGNIIVANANNEHADLFRACRGGGGGSLCIVTEFVYEPIPLAAATLSRFGITFEDAAAFINAYQSFVPTAAENLTCSMSFSNRPGHDTPRMGMSSIVIGKKADWHTVMDPFIQQIEDANVGHTNPNPTESNPAEIAAMFGVPDWHDYTICQDLPTARSLDKSAAFKSTSVYIDDPLTSDGINTFLSVIEERQNDASFTTSASISMDCYGGQITNEPEGGSVICHRNATAVSQIITAWDKTAEASYIKKNIDWINDTRKTLAAVATSGAYVNYCDDAIEDWETAYWGDQYPFLQHVKYKYDSENVFNFPQSIRLP